MFHSSVDVDEILRILRLNEGELQYDEFIKKFSVTAANAGTNRQSSTPHEESRQTTKKIDDAFKKLTERPEWQLGL